MEANSTSLKLTVNKLDRSEMMGDWHDKPLRWFVSGMASGIQKFSTKKEALEYAKIRRHVATDLEAFRAFIAA